MTNGRHRARQLAEIVSDVQGYLSQNREAPEAGDVRKAVSALADARQTALSDQPESKEGLKVAAVALLLLERRDRHLAGQQSGEKES